MKHDWGGNGLETNTYAPRRRTARRGLPPPLRLPAVLFALVLLLLAVRTVLRAVQAPGPLPTAVPEWVTKALLPVNDWSRPGEKLDAVNGVVIHYVGNPGTTAEQNHSYFAGLAQTHEAYVSSNFLIGLDGEAFLCVPVNEVAYCSNDRNNDTLSIEVCHPDDSGAFTDASYDTLVRLVQWAVDTYGLERGQILRHYDVSQKECPRYFVQNPDTWDEFLDRLDFQN